MLATARALLKVNGLKNIGSIRVLVRVTKNSNLSSKVNITLAFNMTLSKSTWINRDNIDDTNTLAAHAIEHDVRTKAGFNSLYRFFILKYEDKEKLTISEQFFMV